MGESLGVLLVLALCGLVLPVALIVGAMLVDLVTALWWGMTYGHDHLHLPSALARLVHVRPSGQRPR